MKSSIFTKAGLGLVCAAMLGLTAGCNTIAGAGKDVSATGNAVTDAAKDTKQKM